MVHLNTFAATAILSFCAAVLAAPAAEEVKRHDPSTLTQPIGFDPSVLSANAKSKVARPIPTIETLDISALLNSNVTEFPPSIIGPPELSKRGIIGGVDNRVLWTNRDFPYRAMGRIETSNGFVCSGALIGPRHVATARHCIPGDGISIRFQPAYDNGEVLGYSDVIHIYRPDYGQTGWCANAYDWAIFVINDRLGESTRLGSLGLKVVNPDTQLNRAMFFHYGYPGDKGGRRPYRQEAITASAASYCDRGSPVIIDADCEGGQSGGPLWINENGSRFLYGIIVGSNSEITAAAGGPSLVAGYAAALKLYP